MSEIKRLYFYLVAFVALIVSGVGAATLLGPLVDRIVGTPLLGDTTTSTSLGLAMLITGVPVWLIHWGTAQRYARQSAGEVGTVLRKLYLNAVMFISALVTVFSAYAVLTAGFGVRGEEIPGPALARILVWGALWGYHWSVETREGQPSVAARTLRSWYVYVTAGYGLGLLVVGVVVLLRVFLTRTFEAVFPNAILNAPPLWNDEARSAVVRIMLGAGWWGFHWLFAARRDRDSVLRQVYLYLFAVLGGIATVLVTVTMILYQTLRFVLRGVDSSATIHFTFLTDLLPALLAGAALWIYHAAVVREEASQTPVRVRGAGRAYRYILAAAGLLAVSAAVTVVVSVLLGAFTTASRGDVTSPKWWQDPVSAAIALLVVGFPLWLVMWSAAQRQAETGGVVERAALSRRLFLYVVLGAGALVILGNLSFVLFRLFEGLMDRDLGLPVLQDIRFSLGMVLAAALFTWYYLAVLREDQAVGAEAAVGRKGILLLAPEGSGDLAQQLEETLGARPRLLGSLPAAAGPLTLTAEQAQALATEVAAASGDNVLLVVEDGRVRVYGYK